MDEEKIRRFLDGVNRGLDVSKRRLQAEQDYLERLRAHLGPLRKAIEQLYRGNPEHSQN